jgi:outer membrane lipoprotein-sorting protein
MNKLIVAFLLILSNTIALAQPAGFKEVKNITSFQQELTKANTSIQDIVSDFTQVKNMSLLAEKIKSKGKFYYKKDDKVRIEYTQPFTYLLVMNSGQVMVKDEQKTSKINTKNSKAMQSVNRIMIDCMRGTVLQNADFKVTVFDNASVYMLNMVPVNDAMKKMFLQINVYLSKKSFNVDKLSMVEIGGDYTDMNFVNAQHNTGLNESLFKVK